MLQNFAMMQQQQQRQHTEQDLGDDIDPNTFHLFWAFPPAVMEEYSDVGPSIGTQFYSRRVYVPLVELCERLATAFEGRMPSPAFYSAVDTGSGMGSEMLTNMMKILTMVW